MRKQNKEIIRAVFDIDFTQFMSLYNAGYFTPSLCQDSEEMPYPLHFITICWDIIFGYLDEWKDEFKTILRQRKEENDKFKTFFGKQGLDMSNIPFSDYSDVFFCEESDSSVEECLCLTEDELGKLGFRDMDIELACCVEKFQFERVEQLLEQGADPLKNRSEDEDDCEDCVTRIDREVQYIYSEFTDKVLGKKKLRKGFFVYDRDFGYLFGLAAHEKMDHLLDKYY